jgi:ATP-binding protein involved in chromosome partitioning
MAEELSEEEIRKALAPIKHPAIDRTLVDLGIVKDIKVEGSTAMITMAYPFPAVPELVKQILENLVSEPIKKMGGAVKVERTIMNHEEVQKFLAMERVNWKGLR